MGINIRRHNLHETALRCLQCQDTIMSCKDQKGTKYSIWLDDFPMLLIQILLSFNNCNSLPKPKTVLQNFHEVPTDWSRSNNDAFSCSREGMTLHGLWGLYQLCSGNIFGKQHTIYYDPSTNRTFAIAELSPRRNKFANWRKNVLPFAVTVALRACSGCDKHFLR